MAGRNKFLPFKRGAREVLPCLEVCGGGAQNVLDPQFSYFVGEVRRHKQ